MARATLLGLSVVACGFGILFFTSSGFLADAALLVNFLLAALLAVLTWQDLRSRGWQWQAPMVGLSYLAAPLVGRLLYAATSNRPRQDEPLAPSPPPARHGTARHGTALMIRTRRGERS